MDVEYQQDEVSLQKQQLHHQQQQQRQQQQQQNENTVIDDGDDESDNSDDSDDPYTPHGQCSRHFLLTLASNFCFVVASAFYIALGAVGLRFMKRTANYPDYVLQADDDFTWHEYSAGHGHNDDVVFTVGHENDDDDATNADSGFYYYVTLYQLFYFCAALGFVFTGVLDCINEPDMLGSLLILAGIFGLGSAAMSERDDWISEVLNATSVHLFLLEAAGMFLYRHASAKYKRRHDPYLQHVLATGKGCFLVGSFIDVILSYIALFGTYNLIHAKIEIFSATLWYICSLIFILHTVAEESKLRLHKVSLLVGASTEMPEQPLTSTRSRSTSSK